VVVLIVTHFPDFLCVSSINVLAGVGYLHLYYWCVIRGGVMLAAPTLVGRLMAIDSAGVSGKGNKINPCGKIKKQKNIYHHFETNTYLSPSSPPLLFFTTHYLSFKRT
jgi:hypothetical protein